MSDRFHSFDSVLIFFILAGVLAYLLGTGMNALVLHSNNGVMPSEAPEMSLLEPEKGFPRGYATKETRYRFLGDTALIDFENIDNALPANALGRSVLWWGRVLDYPLEGGMNFISLGDMLRFGGSALFLLLLPVLLIRLLCRLGGRT